MSLLELWKKWQRSMPDIVTPVTFSEAQLIQIEFLLESPLFTFADWDVPELEKLRSHIRNHYRIQQNGICAYCKNPVSLTSAANCQVEHIAPKSKYRSHIFEPLNLCVICADCNTTKREQEVLKTVPDTIKNGATRKKYPRSISAFLIVQPHFDEYDKHIVVVNKTYYLDKTKVGHFTIGACVLNRRLRAFGWEMAYEDADVAAAAKKYFDTKEPLARSAALRKLKELVVLL